MSRRQRSRRFNRILGRSFIVAIVLFGIFYLLFRNSMNQSIYSQVLASNGTSSFSDIQTFYLICLSVICLLPLWLFIAVIGTFVSGGRSKTFEFDAPATSPQVQVQVYSSPRYFESPRPRAINLYRLSPDEFEFQVARMIEQKGYRARKIGGRGDGGADIEVFNQQGQRIGIVQCKRYDPNKTLPQGFVRELATTRQMYGVNIAYLATTARFSEDTYDLAEQLSIRLIDGNDLQKFMRKYMK